MKLLATYKFKNQYHLMFPYAKENLRQYWQSNSLPCWDWATRVWFLRQICGLVSALNAIHNFEVNSVPVVKEDINSTFNKVSGFQGAKLRVDEHEKFGRHGDLKPENILRLEGTQGSDNAGVLQITDFGLGRFHRFESRSLQDPTKISGSPTYAPPEIALGRPVSRAYDIWSLGCIFLEFITWLLEGATGLEKFNASRDMVGEDGIKDDIYFTIITPKDPPNSRPYAEFREGVARWIGHLRQSPRCSPMSNEFLDLIEKEMFVVDSRGRISAEVLQQRIKAMLAKGEDDMHRGYLLGTNETAIDSCSGMNP
jgi:serine/threonine protein kinase